MSSFGYMNDLPRLVVLNNIKHLLQLISDWEAVFLLKSESDGNDMTAFINTMNAVDNIDNVMLKLWRQHEENDCE